MAARPLPESATAPRPVRRASHRRCAAYAPPRPWSSRRRCRSRPAPSSPRARGREEALLPRAHSRWSGARREELAEEAREGEQPRPWEELEHRLAITAKSPHSNLSSPLSLGKVTRETKQGLDQDPVSAAAQDLRTPARVAPGGLPSLPRTATSLVVLHPLLGAPSRVLPVPAVPTAGGARAVAQRVASAD
jgi:hypothetical protein